MIKPMLNMLLSVLAFVILCSATTQAQNAQAQSCQCVPYARSATGIQIYGNANQWDNLASQAGYRLASRPMTGFAINFEAGAYGAHQLYGHVGKVMSWSQSGNNWLILVRHANWGTGTITEHGCNNVSERWFTITAYDSRVHFIYDPRRVPIGPYLALEGEAITPITGSVHLPDPDSILTIESTEAELEERVKFGQPVRILAKAIPETKMWVFIESSNHPGRIFALMKTELNSMTSHLVDLNATDKENASFSPDYADEVMDLGINDFSKLAGIGGFVKVTIKSGNDPQNLETLQTFVLRIKR